MLVAMETYKEKHIIFLQGLMCKVVLNSKEVNALYEKALAVCKIRGKDQTVFLNIPYLDSENYFQLSLKPFVRTYLFQINSVYVYWCQCFAFI